MPTWRGLLERWPHSVLQASEEAVGLPPGQMGNSEVGHLNLGAGRPVLQDLPRIDAAIAAGSFGERPALSAACARARDRGRPLHVISLIGPGGVHANDRHLVAIAELASRRGVAAVRVHALLDGRDTPPASALVFMLDLEARLAAVHPGAGIATVGGRYYAMDRDRRWERT
jgi:2,3-bisphosphoglycerate-independent phosphoglycerate mutase